MNIILSTIFLFFTLNTFALIYPNEVNRGEKLMEDIDSVTTNIPDPGQFTDNRDGKIYKTVKIGSQTWMAENLSFRPENGKYGEVKIDTINSQGFGLFYEIETALKSCPEGWKLPSREDWNILNQTIDSASFLKSVSGWRNYEEFIYVSNGMDGFNDTNYMWGEPVLVSTGKMLSGNGDNKLLFNAIPAGEWGLVVNEYYPINIRNTGFYAEWWAADEGYVHLDLFNEVSDISIRRIWNNNFDSYKNVRCIKKQEKENIEVETVGEEEVIEKTETKKESETKKDDSTEDVKEIIKNLRGIFRR